MHLNICLNFKTQDHPSLEVRSEMRIQNNPLVRTICTIILPSYQYIQINFMEKATIKAILAKPNLALGQDIVNRVYDFLQKHIGISSENIQEDVFAALAIVGEVADLRPVNSGAMVHCGIALEVVLRHLGGLSKESLLEVVARQCMKWREAPVWLAAKIDNVKLAYRIYKKYRAVFEAITTKRSLMEMQSRFNLMAIFWVVFLFIKNESKQLRNAIEATTILYSLFKFIFGEIITQLTQTQIASYFRQQFTECQPPSEQAYYAHRERMLFHLNSTYQWRYKHGELNLQSLATDDHFMTRFLDDIANNYDRFKIDLPKHSVDEISFLQLDKTLTPQSIKRDYVVPQATICKRMNFADDDDGDDFNPQPNEPIEAEAEPFRMLEENVSKQRRPSFSLKMEPLSPFRPLSKHHYNRMSPLTARHQNLSWVNNITCRCSERDGQELQRIYQQYTQQCYMPYEEKVMNSILESIKEFTPSCMDFCKRQKSVFSFFTYFISMIYQKHTEDERKAIFQRQNSFDSILSLSVNLFNYAYQSLQSSYRQYCQVFGIGIIEGMLPINWFGCNVEMPKNIEGYLYDLEKKILIQEIWEDEEGYQLLIGPNSYQGQAILKRLRTHADERTQELCESLGIERKLVTKVVNLVRYILERRQGLLRGHKIDQIIVCSIASVMSINRSRNFSLQDIFNHYNRLLYSLNISKSIFFTNEGQQIDLIDYYNHIFLEQVDEILSNEEQAKKVLDTPIRNERIKKIQQGRQLTPSTVRFKQVAPIGSMGIKKLKLDSQGKPYRNQIAVSLKNLNINEQEEEHQMEDFPSPSFKQIASSNSGQKDEPPNGMFRTFSFGEFGEKF